MASGTSPKRDKVMLLLKQGETSPTIIANKVGCAVSYARLVKDEFLRSQEAPASSMVMEPCARCRAKGIVVCPTCQGTGDIRNQSYAVVDRCHDCLKEIRGFVTCPSCLGKKVADNSQLRRSYRLERERLRSIPSVWGYENAAFLSSPTLPVKP